MTKNVSVPEGYKKTELGVIPEEWEVIKLGNENYFQIVSGGTPSRNNPEYWTNGSINWATPTDITKNKGYFLDSTKEKINEIGLKNSSAKIVPKGSVLLTSRATIGAVAINNVDLATNQGFANFVLTEAVCNYYLLLTLEFNKQKLESLGGQSTFKEVSKTALKNFEIFMPPLPEQQKIASILSKVDEQIEQTEQIIEKTELLKKGLMQKLLTKGIGHTKFKKVKIGTKYYNIPINWDVKNIESTFFLKGRIGWQGLTTKEYLNEGTYFLVTGTDFNRGKINWDTCVYVSEERYLQDSNIQLENGDLLVTKDGTIGKIAYIDKLKKPATLNSGIFLLRSLNNGCYPEYLYNILNSFYFELFISILKAGSTISHLYQKDFAKFSFPLPELDEQQKIAFILSKVDSHIQDNQNYLNKLQELKKGLMQDLLIGKVRVCV